MFWKLKILPSSMKTVRQGTKIFGSNRILFMKDGEIKTSLNREQENKQAFFADILKKIEWIEGGS